MDAAPFDLRDTRDRRLRARARMDAECGESATFLVAGEVSGKDAGRLDCIGESATESDGSGWQEDEALERGGKSGGEATEDKGVVEVRAADEGAVEGAEVGVVAAVDAETECFSTWW